MTNVLIENRGSPLTINKFEANSLMADKLKNEALTNTKAPTLHLDDQPIMIQQWQHYIERKIGFVLPSAQSKWLLNSVEQTAAQYKLSVRELWNAVQTNNQLRQQLLDTVLIPESRFFRHEPSLSFITALAIKAINNDSQEGVDEPFRIWSVGCSTGQEVWSLTMALEANNLANYMILGTDVSRQALQTARSGQYNQQQKALIPSKYHRFVQPLITDEQEADEAVPQNHSTLSAKHALNPDRQIPIHTQAHWQVVPRLHEQVRFIWHNIFTQRPATLHLQQVILCQNVLIYFRQFDQRDILARLAAQCVLGGYIILAPGEALFWRPSNMRRVAHTQINAWQKISA